MKLEKLILGNLVDYSKSELIDVVMTLVKQVAQVTKQSAFFAEQGARLNEQNALVTEQCAQLHNENAAHVQRVSDLEQRVGLIVATAANHFLATAWQSRLPRRANAREACATLQTVSLATAFGNWFKDCSATTLIGISDNADW